MTMQHTEMIPKMQTTFCIDCRYVERQNDQLYCHRNPPPWPIVASNNWCGEWVKAKANLRPLKP
jgi:hypothetical protein